jgi:hypothetical protein
MHHARVLVAGTLAAFAMLLAAASSAFAAEFAATVTPGSVTDVAAVTYTVTLTNTSHANPPLNAAIVQPPAGFTLTATSRPSGSGNAVLRSGQVVLRGLSLHPGQSESVAITASDFGTCGPASWNIHAFASSLRGRRLSLDSVPVTTVDCGMLTTQTCPAGGACSPATVKTSDSTVDVTTGPGTDSGTVTLSVDPGTRPTCQDYEPRDTHWYGVFESTGERSKTITETLFDTSTNGLQVCFAAPYEFETATDQNAPPGPLPDGTHGFVGLLETCEPGPESPEACVQSIVPSEDGAVITIRIDGGLDGDPWFGP